MVCSAHKRPLPAEDDGEAGLGPGKFFCTLTFDTGRVTRSTDLRVCGVLYPSYCGLISFWLLGWMAGRLGTIGVCCCAAWPVCVQVVANCYPPGIVGGRKRACVALGAAGPGDAHLGVSFNRTCISLRVSVSFYGTCKAWTASDQLIPSRSCQ